MAFKITEGKNTSTLLVGDISEGFSWLVQGEIMMFLKYSGLGRAKGRQDIVTGPFGVV